MSAAYEALTRNRMELLIQGLTNTQIAATASRLELIQSKRTPTSEVIVEDSYETTARLLEGLRDKGKMDNPLEDPDTMDGPETDTPMKERLQMRYEGAKFDLTDKSDMLKINLEWVRRLAAEMNAGYRLDSAVPALTHNLYAELYAGLYKSRRAPGCMQQDNCGYFTHRSSFGAVPTR